jgi:predicted adenylyl cyclase CyaB
MGHVNIEIKARCGDADRIRRILRERGAEFRGVDHQVDTYFAVLRGRLKLRRGNIENTLIFYQRPDQAGPKRADVSLVRTDAAHAAHLHETLTAAMDVLVVVDKRREIYFIDNVKFHLDRVMGLGEFLEIEAIDEHGTIGAEALGRQCDEYIALLGIDTADLVHVSYSDMLMGRAENEQD